MEDTLLKLIELIDEPNRSFCREFYTKNSILFENAKGSQTKHQAWAGGYKDHIVEVMNHSVTLYRTFCGIRPLPFSLSDTLLVLFLHDIEKLYNGDPSFYNKSKTDRKKFKFRLIQEAGFKLTPEHWNGIFYVEGENEDYHPTERIQGPLAAFCHICDVLSARIWFDYPKKDKN